MKALPNMTRAKLAKAAGISKGRVSQIFNDPGNISLDTVVRLSRALGMKVTVTAYEDVNDPGNERGPVNSDIFRIIWERAGRPVDMWDIQALPQAAAAVAAPAPSQFTWVNNDYDGLHSKNARRKTTGTPIAPGMEVLLGTRAAGRRFEKEGPVS
jgi:transcriptional regulator with XRE-family HTH domain